MRARAIPSIDDGRPLPDPRNVDDDLIAVDGSLTIGRLLEAYGKGIFPWTARPVTWWSPDPRAVLDLAEIHVPRRLRTRVKSPPYRVTFDTAFREVIEACASVPRGDEDTWITPEFLNAYGALHDAGFAHSIELWRGEQLAAGVYGVTLGGLFAGESMFHRETDASKVALILLQQQLQDWGFILFDTQVLTPVTEALGARLIPREEYLDRLQDALQAEPRAAWKS